MKSPFLILCFSMLYLTIFCQSNNSTKHQFSTFIGGLSDFKDGAFLYAGAEYSLTRNLSLNFTLHRDDTRERWDDGSKGYYAAYFPTASLRFSWFPNGRGFFAQGGAGYVNANLKVTDADGKIKKEAESGWGANWKFGYRWSPRWGKKAKGFFAEALWNYSTTFDDLILQTETTPAGTEMPRPTLDWRSWNIYKGDVGSTFLIGIGYTW